MARRHHPQADALWNCISSLCSISSTTSFVYRVCSIRSLDTTTATALVISLFIPQLLRQKTETDYRRQFDVSSTKSRNAEHLAATSVQESMLSSSGRSSRRANQQISSNSPTSRRLSTIGSFWVRFFSLSLPPLLVNTFKRDAAGRNRRGRVLLTYGKRHICKDSPRISELLCMTGYSVVS